MSILNLCNAGSVLEKPTPSIGVINPLAEKALRDQILKDCLPAQKDFLEDETHRMLSYIGGFGSGKSWALAAKLIFLGLRNPGTTMMACEPTFVMVRQVLMPALDNAFDQWGIEYQFRASPTPEYTLMLPTGQVNILCMSAENYQRIRGQNISAAVWDEADTSPVETAQKASEMLLARMRSGNFNQLAIASTPEGYKFCFRSFVENDGPDKRLIRVQTQDNPYLPEDFIPSLERNYPKQLIAAYLRGEFTNLASCALYPEFDRSQHYTDAVATDLDTVHIGIDLNVGCCLTQHMIRRGDEFHFFNEAVFRDTQQISNGLKEMYPEHFRRGQLILIPDAASRQRSTAAAQESDLGILKREGHQVKVQTTNPLIADRINAVNSLIEAGRLRVSNRCPNLIRTLEQHSYDDSGRPLKGGTGVEDLSHAGDAMGYAIYRYAAIRSYKIGSGKSRMASIY